MSVKKKVVKEFQGLQNQFEFFTKYKMAQFNRSNERQIEIAVSWVCTRAHRHGRVDVLLSAEFSYHYKVGWLLKVS